MGGSGPPTFFWTSFLILSKPGRNVCVGGDITLSFYTQDIRVLGIRTPPTSLGLATPLQTLIFAKADIYLGGAKILGMVLNISGEG